MMSAAKLGVHLKIATPKVCIPWNILWDLTEIRSKTFNNRVTSQRRVWSRRHGDSPRRWAISPSLWCLCYWQMSTTNVWFFFFHSMVPSSFSPLTPWRQHTAAMFWSLTRGSAWVRKRRRRAGFKTLKVIRLQCRYRKILYGYSV